MKRALLLLMLAAAVPAQAQVMTPAAVDGCQYVSAGITLQNFQRAPLTCDSTGSLRIGGTINATSALNAASSLTTFSPGSQALQGSLAGGLYVQPIFSSALGGGTQVDATHGLPVNIVAGGTSSLSVGPTGSAVPGSADYAGMNVSGTLTGLVGTANGLKVDGSAVTQPVSASALPLPSGASTAANQATIISTLGSPFQAGGSIGNTSFGATQSGTWNINNISGTITLPTGASTAANQATAISDLATLITNLGSPFQAGGSIANTTFAATQSGTWNITNITGTVSLPTGAATAAGLTTINTTLGTPMQNSGGSVTANAGTNLNTSALATSANLTAGTAIAQPITTVTNSALVKGTASQTATTSTSLISAVTSQRIYVTNAFCSNSGASASLVAFQDGSGGTTLASVQVPAGGGNNLAGTFPLFWTTAGNALFFAPGTASTTVVCNASGYSSVN